MQEIAVPETKRPRGRPAGHTKPVEELGTKMIRMRATPAELDKYKALGGSTWLRKALHRAKAPVAA